MPSVQLMMALAFLRHQWHFPITFLLLLLVPLTSSSSVSSATAADDNGGGELPLHPSSPPHRKVPPTPSLQYHRHGQFQYSSDNSPRAKRQAYQVYLGNEVSVSVDRGQKDSGPWGPWTVERECSRTCGGGVFTERRICGGDGHCAGPSIRYISCNLEPCPADAMDFRAEQCAAHNDDPVSGKYYKWVPHTSKNKCELTCRPEADNFYYNWAEKVIDGTKCDAYGEEICVDGICLPVGCDGKLGSDAKRDKCGVCQGDGSQCKTVEGLFDERALPSGYHDIIALPAGATAIHIEELRPSSNVFAIKNATGFFYLNGNFQIQVLDKNIMAGGVPFKYEKGNGGTERLTANGPLKESVTVSLLLQRTGAKQSAVKYEYSVPLEKDVKYLYKPGEWSQCSVTCGRGVHTRALYCTETDTQVRVDDSVCDENNATKPEFEKKCTTVDCQPEWFVGEWEPCSTTCGDRGVQFRVLYCHRVFADGRRMTVSDANCTEERGLPRPDMVQPCARWSCPEWQAGPWSACSSQCGDAKQFRSVTCRSAKEGEEGKLLPAEACTGEKPPEERDCNLGPCKGLRFHTTEWQLCQKCNDTEETREVSCVDKNGREYPLEKCLDGKKVTKIPEDTRPCASQAPCIYEWHTSQWSKCSTECGHGHKQRKVFCAINELGQTKRVDEALCGQSAEEKPVAREECVNEEKCTGIYFTGPWSNCTAKCGGGTQTRTVVCLNYDKKPVPEWCDEKEKPPEQQECGMDKCQNCTDSEFGCCPDGVSYASGPYLEGCSNCSSVAEFGCCADNVTAREDAQGTNCPPTAADDGGMGKKAVTLDEEEGSGEEPSSDVETVPSSAAKELCEIENEVTKEKLQIPCAEVAVAETLNETVQLIKMAAGNETAAAAAETNATEEAAEKHCSKTEFGCCPDWSTPAEGPNYAGCPKFVLGYCNGTKFGCCPDDVSMSRGPDFEGCGEPTCAASTFGCCKDRRTIAFGPHYAGCDRSSFPCELSTYGCCEDGETAALGHNGTGCGASCLLTKFGCCPDGKTHAQGANNEGCGCEYAQYGCCPDGHNAAKGPGFYGCPESCAQSKFGCCPDGKTIARGPNKEGCPCQYTRWGCCPDGETTALGPLNEGCDDCRYAKYGCCLDGVSKAIGPDYAGCPTTTPAPYMIGGTVSPSYIVSCSLPQDTGQVCQPGYQLVWHYDMAEGSCSQFWYGGCGGNNNRFTSKEQCEQICVEPPHIGRCYLPRVEGPQRCTQLAARYYYDYLARECVAFWWRGCRGNANNFGSWDECQSFCSSADASNVQLQAPYQPASAPAVASPAAPPPPVQPQDIHAPPLTHPPQTVAILPAGVEEAGELQKAPVSAEEACRQNVDSGTCQNYVDQWYFDPFTGACFRFIYSGCGGNQNRFGTEAECLRQCGHLRKTKPGFLGPTSAADVAVQAVKEKPKVEKLSTGRKALTKSRDVCNLRLDLGKCIGNFERWYYEVASGQCEKFIYTGCGGNGNRFTTLDECQAVCVRRNDLPSAGPQNMEQHLPPASLPIGTAGAEKEKPQPLPALPNGHLALMCEVPKDSGPCKTFSTKWYYNTRDGTCNRFHYGGCDGNANRFDTEEQCKSTCWNYKDPCVLPKVSGPCEGHSRRFFFDLHSNQCLPFEYGGCLGNTNNFHTMEECQARCHPTRPNPIVVTATTNPWPVRLTRANPSTPAAAELLDHRSDPVHTNHMGQISSSDKKQQQFISPFDADQQSDQQTASDLIVANDDQKPSDQQRSDWVQHNDDQQTLPLINDQNEDGVVVGRADGQQQEVEIGEGEVEEEELIIVPREHLLYGQLPELCLLPEQRGTCFGEQLRYRYDPSVGDCVGFFFTGCAANANNFGSYEACARACAAWKADAVCERLPDAGRDRCDTGGNDPRQERRHNNAMAGANVPKWYYNASLGKCALFFWSGCGGNGNRFQSKSECENLCRHEMLATAAKRREGVCMLPMDAGPCADLVTMWYFDAAQRQCRRFTFGGCRGNANRFVSRADCESQCRTATTAHAGAVKDNAATDQNSASGINQNVQQQQQHQRQQKWYAAPPYRRRRPRLFASPVGILLVGTSASTLTLKCVADAGSSGTEAVAAVLGDKDNNEEDKFTWYKDGREMSTALAPANGAEGGQQRIKYFQSVQPTHAEAAVGGGLAAVGELRFRPVTAADGGAYACAFGTLISDPVTVRVVEQRGTKFSECAGDNGPANVCHTVAVTGLCSTLRYGRYCCRTCADQNEHN